MHSALWQLVWFDFRGALRGLVNIRRNWRQLVLFLLMLLFAGVFISFRAFARDVSTGRFGAAMPFWSFIYLLATWLTGSADRGLVMRPAEVHFVVGGPFSRRDVITLNLVRLAFRAFLSASVLSLIALAYVRSYPSALTGIWLLISVSLLVGMLASLSARGVHGRLVRLARRAVTVLGISSLVILIAQSMQLTQAAGLPLHVSTIAQRAVDTPLGSWLLPPVQWMFAPISQARFFPDAIALLPARLAVLGLLVAAIYAMGRRFSEASTNRTDQSLQRKRTALRSGVAGGAAAAHWTRRLRVPMPSRLGGIGSVAFTQITHALRIFPRYLVFTSTIVVVVLVIPLMVDRGQLQGWGTVSWITGLTLYADFLLLLQLPVGFLGPASQREMLKSLPIDDWKIVLGQLAGPLTTLSFLHLAITVLFICLVPEQTGRVLAIAIALLPAGLVVTVNINLLGVWNVVRPKVLQQRDALAAGRAMASVWIFFAMLTPAIIVASVTAALAGLLTQGSFAGYLTGAALGTAASSVFYIALLARAFARWQPVAHAAGFEEVEHDN